MPDEVTPQNPTTESIENDDTTAEEMLPRAVVAETIRSRLARQRVSLETEFLGVLGVETLDEAVKHQREAATLRERVAEYEAREQAAREQQARDAQLRVVSAAMTEQGFRDPHEALVLLPTLDVNVDGLVTDDSVNREAFDALVARLRDEKPHWFTPVKGSPSNAGAGARSLRVDTEEARQAVMRKWRM